MIGVSVVGSIEARTATVTAIDRYGMTFAARDVAGPALFSSTD